jgi:putative sterol carrier protein
LIQIPRADISNATGEFFDSLAQRGHEPLLEKAKGTIGFELTDGKRVERWLVELKGGDVGVSRRNIRADCRVRVKKDLFDEIVVGKANGMAAFLRGALAIEGQYELMAVFQRVFPGPPAKRARRRGGATTPRRS